MPTPRIHISREYLKEQLKLGLSVHAVAERLGYSHGAVNARIEASEDLRRIRDGNNYSRRRRQGDSAIPIVSERYDWQNDDLPPEDNWRRVFPMNAKGKDVCVLPLPGGRYVPAQKPRFIPKGQFLANYRPVPRENKAVS